MTPEIKELLLQFDEPGAYDRPSDFDYERLECKARAVALRFENELGERITFQDGWCHQDASFSIAIVLDSHKSDDDRGLICPNLRFSNFGDMVTLGWEEKLSIDRVSAIRRILVDEGFRFVPVSELSDPYDGVMRGEFATWWIRYFDWL